MLLLQHNGSIGLCIYFSPIVEECGRLIDLLQAERIAVNVDLKHTGAKTTSIGEKNQLLVANLRVFIEERVETGIEGACVDVACSLGDGESWFYL